MAAPEAPARKPFAFSTVLVLAGLVISAVLAVLILLTTTQLSVIEAIGWVFVVLSVYLASLLVP